MFFIKSNILDSFGFFAKILRFIIDIFTFIGDIFLFLYDNILTVSIVIVVLFILASVNSN